LQVLTGGRRDKSEDPEGRSHSERRISGCPFSTSSSRGPEVATADRTTEETRGASCAFLSSSNPCAISASKSIGVHAGGGTIQRQEGFEVNRGVSIRRRGDKGGGRRQLVVSYKEISNVEGQELSSPPMTMGERRLSEGIVRSLLLRFSM
jgi:hypothetical protein